MVWLHRNLRQTVTYWAPGAPDGYGGLSFSAPVTMKGRWEDRVELIRDSFGEETVSQAVAYLTQDVVVRGYLYEGSSTASSPLSVDGAKKIIRVDKTPTLNAQYNERKAFL